MVSEHDPGSHPHPCQLVNQVEIYFSVIERKVLTPNDFVNLEELESRVFDFQKLYENTATAFQWKFTRQDLKMSWHAFLTQRAC